MSTRTIIWATTALLGVVALSSASASAQSITGQSSAVPPTGMADGFTQPSEDAELTAPTQAIVAEVLVKRGDVVKAGQPLIRQDSRVEQKQLEVYEHEAKSRIRVDAAEAERDLKEFTLEKVKSLHTAAEGTGRSGAASEIELRNAQLDYVLSLNQVKLAEHEVAQNALEAERQRARIQLMEVLAPFDGIVERIEVSKGEVTDPQRPVIRVVANNPLKVIVPNLTPQQAAQFKVGDSVQVRYDGEQEWLDATVKFVSATVNVGSGTREVELEMDNEAGRESGLPVLVKIPNVPVAEGSDTGISTAR